MNVIPENIHTSPKDGFLVLTPNTSGNSSLALYVPFKMLAFENPHPLGISKNHSSGGYGYSVLELHIMIDSMSYYDKLFKGVDTTFHEGH